MEKSWHPHCFSCTECSENLVGKKKYGVFEDQPYCPIHTPMGIQGGEKESGEKREEKKKEEGKKVTQMDMVRFIQKYF